MKNHGAPKCPLHVGTEMVAVETGRPSWLNAGEGLEHGIPKTGKQGARKIYKCPVEGCRRVKAYLPKDDELGEYLQRDCPCCGERTDAPGERRARGDNLCKACNKAKSDHRNAATRLRVKNGRAAREREAA